MNLTLEEIKQKADEKIGQKIKVALFTKEGQLIADEYEIESNKINKHLNMVLTHFKDSSNHINALLTISEKAFEIIKEE